MSQPTAPPGWYPDPAAASSSERYWDGRSWTGHARPAVPFGPAAAAPAGAAAWATGGRGQPGPTATGWPTAPGTYGGHPGRGYQPGARPGPAPVNGFAIASIVCSIASLLTFGLGALLGIVFGHVALHQLRTSGEGGRGLAIAGLVIGYVLLVLAVILLVAVIVAASHAANNGSSGTAFSLGQLGP